MAAACLACLAFPAPSPFLKGRWTHSPTTSLQTALHRKYFLACACPRQRSCLHYLHTTSYCSWKDLKGGFISKRVMCLQSSMALEILCSALGWVFPLPWVAGLIRRRGALNFGGTRASVLHKSAFLCLKALSRSSRVGSLVAPREGRGSWDLMAA